MTATAYARGLGLLIGIPLAAAFVLQGGVDAPRAGTATTAPSITAGQSGSLEVKPSRVIRLPRRSDPGQKTSATMKIRNTDKEPLEAQFSAVAPGAGSSRYLLTIRSRGRLLFRGTPGELRERSTRAIRVAPGGRRPVPIHMVARLRPESKAEEPHSFELQWTTSVIKAKRKGKGG